MADSILQRVAAGDSAAIKDCLDRYSGLVWSLTRRFAPVSEAEDAVQEIFLDVWKSSARYDPSVASEATFIAMIARRRLIDRRRRSSRQIGTGPELLDVPEREVRDLAAASELGEDVAAAARALETLRPDQQRVLRLSIYQGLSHEKIAESTGIPLGTVKTHVRRGLIRLREILSGQPESADRAQEEAS